jgi:hypothetical protein
MNGASRAEIETESVFTSDFLALPFDVPRAELAFSIEAFVHGPNPRAYFEAGPRYLVPGGALVVCDDFPTDAADLGCADGRAQ